MTTRRSYGTGTLLARRDGNGQETWYGRWHVNGQRRNRKLGLKRAAGTRDGLTKPQAEAELRRLVEASRLEPLSAARVTVTDAGSRYVSEAEAQRRKKSTLSDYRDTIRVHFEPHFGEKPLDRLTAQDVREFMAAKAREGKAAKSVNNYVILLSSIFELGCQRGWCRANPCKAVKRAKVEQTSDIRFLEVPDLEAVLRAEAVDDWSPLLRAMYLTAAMSGLRLGELRGLRWRDVDWPASRLRVRQNYVRGEFGTPKSRRSSRSVPMADRLAGELERYFQQSDYQDDDDLVFASPLTGNPVGASFPRVRFKAALKRAKLRELRFHDLRHTFGTQMAAAGVPMRTLQEWLGHRDFATTLLYADYAPSPHEAELVEGAFSSDRSSDRSEQTEGAATEPDTAMQSQGDLA